MELWTEYEGTTIDGAFPLKKLLLPEGRSAFFSTSNGKGGPTVIRLVACHFDEEEILARWRGIEALGHPSLLKLDHFGQVVLDDAAVVYAVIEPVNANLAEVVSRQRLTVPEAKQLAASLASALEVLHANGFVHEHVEPANIFAVDEVVKLRSDCVRETPEGETGRNARKRDVHDLGVVLLQALTQERSLEAAAGKLPLATPFNLIVPNAINGTWTLAEIAGALQSPKQAPVRPSTPVPSPVRAPVSQAAVAPPPAPAAVKPAEEPKPAAQEVKTMEDPPLATRAVLRAADPIPRTGAWVRLIATASIVLFLFLWAGWHFAHGVSANHSNARPSPPAAPSGSAPASDSAAPAASSQGNGSVASPQPAQNNAMERLHAVWRVVAYTYDHKDQAQKKSATVTQKHPELRPEVFTPNGHAPFLVTLGGTLSREQAFALAHKARNLGLPRDTYAQNYMGNAK